MNERIVSTTLAAGLLVMLSIFILAVPAVTAPVVVSGGATNDYESWIERLDDGRIMCVFDRNPDWASGDIYVTFSDDDGASWSTPVAIISEAGDQATLSFVELPTDTLRLFYASNETGNYGIHSAWSLDGLTWITEGKLNLGWASGTIWYDPTVICEDDGSLTMSYVVPGQGVYVAHCPAGGTWDTDKMRVAAAGYRPRIMKHSDGTYLYAYHTRTGTTYEYDVFVTLSKDLVEWETPAQLTTNHNSHDPFPNEMPDDSYMVYYAKYSSPAYNLWRRHSIDGVTWEPEEQITSDITNNTQPHFFTEPPALYLVWAHATANPDDCDVFFERFELPPFYMCGDANGDEVVNVGDAVFIINYIFKGGPAPIPVEAGDANGDEVVNVGDAVYVINYIFKGGPEPVCL